MLFTRTERENAGLSSPPADVTVRSCRQDDLASVLDLWAESRSAYATTKDDLGSVELLLTRDPGSLLVAERSGRVIGTVIAAWDGWRGNMYRLAVASDHRRKGIGLELVRAGERRLYECGARRVTALVGGEDDDAIALWRAAGFEHDRLVARFVKNLQAPRARPG
jgi:ribosomal protein S18 acetylase RimI-like enzyme